VLSVKKYNVTALCHSTDQQQQEQLIEKYMVLPNQVWDDIINQVRKWLRLVSCVGLRGVLVFQILQSYYKLRGGGYVWTLSFLFMGVVNAPYWIPCVACVTPSDFTIQIYLHSLCFPSHPFIRVRLQRRGEEERLEKKIG
jgi:hypothetical protein